MRGWEGWEAWATHRRVRSREVQVERESLPLLERQAAQRRRWPHSGAIAVASLRLHLRHLIVLRLPALRLALPLHPPAWVRRRVSAHLNHVRHRGVVRHASHCLSHRLSHCGSLTVSPTVSRSPSRPLSLAHRVSHCLSLTVSPSHRLSHCVSSVRRLITHPGAASPLT